MTDEMATVRTVIGLALSGEGIHVRTRGALDGLSWELAGERPQGAPHSVFQIVNHIVYWHGFGLAWLDGKKPSTPEHAEESWPGEVAPASQEEWIELVKGYKEGLAAFQTAAAEADLLAVSHKKSVLELLQLIAGHNSYHLGQVAQLRRILGAWPPPGGGETW